MTTQTTPARRPLPLRQVIAFGGLALVIVLLLGLLLSALLSGRQAAGAPAADPALAADVLGAAGGVEQDAELDPISGPSIELLLAWMPGGATFTAPCAAPVEVVARYEHGPQYVRLDCDWDGRPDVWTLFSEVGVSQDDLASYPAENDTHERPLGGE